MEQFLVDYLANATWQIPLLAAGAWLFIRAGKFGPRTQHCVWLAVLALAIVLPLRGVSPNLSENAAANCTDCSMTTPAVIANAPLPRAAIVTQVLVADPRVSQEFFSLPHPTLRLSAAATDWLIGFYFAILLFGLYRILTAWHRARQLVNDADAASLSPRCSAILQQAGHSVGVRLPRLRSSAEVTSPVIVGVRQAVLLLPDDFETHSQNEVQAAFLHELAHVRRRDYLSNLLCQLAALPIAWHPVIYAVQQRIRRTREMICDDIAARAMQSEIGYAKCLLAMAGRTLGQRDMVNAALAIGLFGDNVLEERIMRLMQQKNKSNVRVKLTRLAGGATAMIMAIAIATCFHVTPTLAQASGNVCNSSRRSARSCCARHDCGSSATGAAPARYVSRLAPAPAPSKCQPLRRRPLTLWIRLRHHPPLMTLSPQLPPFRLHPLWLRLRRCPRMQCHHLRSRKRFIPILRRPKMNPLSSTVTIKRMSSTSMAAMR